MLLDVEEENAPLGDWPVSDESFAKTTHPPWHPPRIAKRSLLEIFGNLLGKVVTKSLLVDTTRHNFIPINQSKGRTASSWPLPAYADPADPGFAAAATFLLEWRSGPCI